MEQGNVIMLRNIKQLLYLALELSIKHLLLFFHLNQVSITDKKTLNWNSNIPTFYKISKPF